MNESLFAHINNDAFLKGSFDLQGRTFAETIGYLEQYLKQHQSAVSNDVADLLKTCQGLVFVESALGKIRLEETALKPLCEHIQKEAMALKHHEQLLLPGGWLAPQGGHGLLYQLMKDAKGDFLFCIHNAGDGLQFHPKHSSKEKTLYNPVLTYKIPKHQIERKNFALFIQELLSLQIPNLHRREKIDATFLYHSILPKISYLGGELIEPPEIHEKAFTAGQLSGTCAQRSLHELLKSRFQDLDDYRQFIYRFKAYALDDYMQVIRKDKSIETPKYQSQVEKAIRHQLRLINLKKTKDSTKNLFNPTEKSKETKRLLSYLTELRRLRKNSIPKIPQTPQPLSVSSTIYLQAEIVRPPYPENPVKARLENIEPSMEVTGGPHLLSQLEAMLQKFQRFDSSQHHLAMIEELEHLFNQMPLPDNLTDGLLPFYQGIHSNEEASEFYKKMSQLQTYYFQSCQTLLGRDTVLPRMMISKLSIFAITHHLNFAFPMVMKTPAYGFIIDGIVHGLTTGRHVSTHLATNSPKLDKRNLQVRELYQNASQYLARSNNERYILYYQKIIDALPSSIKTKLEQMYQDRYGNDNSLLQLKVREQRVTTLFFFISHPDELRASPSFKLLFERFEQQETMEQLYSYFTGDLHGSDSYSYNHSTPLNLKLNSNGCLELDSTLNNCQQGLVVSKSLQKNKYSVQNLHIASALTSELPRYAFDTLIKRADNHVQMVPGIHATLPDHETRKELLKHKPSSEDLEDRELFHLRKVNFAQIQLTIDYFNLHLEKIAHNDIKKYIEANLFQPGLLLDILSGTQAETFFEKWDAFIQRGLTYFEKKGELTHDSLFFIRMAYLVNQYAQQQDPIRYGKRLQTFHQSLNALLSSEKDKNIIATIHLYRFLTLTHRNTSFEEALISHFYAQSYQNPNHSLDGDSAFQLECRKRTFIQQLSKHLTEITPQIILNLLKNLHIPLQGDEKDIQVEGSYPLCSIRSKGVLLYTLNLEQGQIYQNNMAYCLPPLSIINHPLTQKLNLPREFLCFVSPNQSLYEISAPPIKLRFIKEGNAYRIQKTWRDPENNERWYELTPTSEAQAVHWQSPHQEINLPILFKERETLTWREVDSSRFLITDQHLDILCDGVFNQGSSYEHRQTLREFCKEPTWIHQHLQDVEDSSFISVWKSAQDVEVQLNRYGLNFRTNPKTGALTWTYDEQKYELQADKLLFEEGVANLVFQHENKRLCILPVLQFISSNQRGQHEYYHLKQDIHHQIPQKMVSKKIKNNNLFCWQYSNTESFIVCPIEQNMPVPTRAADALYLCYVYLGSNQPEKAWKILEDCDKRLGGLAGTDEELKYLEWIFHALPFPLEGKDLEASISNPPYVACKLKALSLLTSYIMQNEAIQTPALINEPKTVNDHHRNESIKGLNTFQSNLNSTIHAHMTRLQAMRRELPGEFQLSDAETKSLLDYYHANVPAQENAPIAVGALGFEWVQLQLNVLKKEAEHLHLNSKIKPLTAYEERRLNEINTFLKEHPGVGKIVSKLKYHPLKLSLPSHVTFSSGLYQYDDIDHFQKEIQNKLSTKTSQEEAISLLTLDMTDVMLMSRFADYLTIATTPNHPLQETLFQFCRATLIACRHVSLFEQPSSLALLCNMLYRFKDNPVPQYPWVYNLSSLIHHAVTLPNPPEILIPELLDETSELMQSTEEIWASTPKPKPIIQPRKMPHEPLDEWLDTNLLTLKKEYLAIHTHVQSKDLDEYAAGIAKYETQLRLQDFALQHLSHENMREALAKRSQTRQKYLQEKEKELEILCLNLAREGPDDIHIKQSWEIELLSGQRKPLDIQQLLTLYFHNDVSKYTDVTGLPKEKIERLHAHLIQYVQLGLQRKQCERVSLLLEDVSKSTANEKPQCLFQLAAELFSDNQVSPVDDPPLSLFQYFENVLLRPQQIEAIQRLLTTSDEQSFDETIEKIIMGGGKSKVILPTMAQRKASGQNLVIIEVPRALLRTNYIDLKATSSRLYAQTPFLFEFNRDSDCSPKRLEQLFHKLTEVMVHRDYMVTTGDALQSLELKYLELLHEAPQNKKEWEQQVVWMERLVLLLKNRGDVIIDEVHQGLLHKTKLNYTMGDVTPISKSLITHALHLYQFFDKVDLSKIVSSKKPITLHDALLQRNLLTDPTLIAASMETLLDALLTHPQSPLRHLFTSFKGELQPLRTYLQGQGDNIPEVILQAPPEFQDEIAFYKEQLSTLLPFTLKRQQGEHYGPSKKVDLSPSEKLQAIPYLANNVPSERSRFGNELESINYTIQSLCISGIPIDMLQMLLNDWQTEAREEVHKGLAKTLDGTPMAATCQSIFPNNLKLSEIDPDNPLQLSSLHSTLSHHKTLIFELLKTHILPKITSNSSILHSDAYSHIDLARTYQGMSGTPWNHSTFHQRLHYAKASGLGSDGYILRGIEQKHPNIRGIDYTTTKEFIHALFEQETPKTEIRSIIDINASFKGVSNLTVAEHLAEYIEQHPEPFRSPKPLKYVLFFNEQNELSALKVQKNIKNQVPIVLGSSDPKLINTRLGCTPLERMTYYDQAHTVGTDIKQAQLAKGLVLIDKDTHLQSFLQGSMRMRGLIEGLQSIDLVVPKALEKSSFQKLTTLMQKNEQRQLQQDNFQSTISKMKNVLRNSFMKQLLNMEGPDALMKKHLFLKQVSRYFIETQASSFFERFGKLNETRSTKSILEELERTMLMDWKALLNHDSNESEERLIKQELQKIVAHALSPNVCEPFQRLSKITLGTEVEVQLETQLEVLTMKDVQQEMYDPSWIPSEFMPWTNLYPKGEHFLSLPDICASVEQNHPKFSPKIQAHQNFYQTHQQQKQFINMYLKPVHAILFIEDMLTKELECVLLSQEECANLGPRLSERKDATCWITTTAHTLLAGTPPEKIRENKTYQSLIEQIRFFNGEFNLLLQRDAPWSWLLEETQEKLDFFNRYLWPCHETSAHDVTTLKNALSINQTIFQKFKMAPWVDYRQTDWAEQYKNISKEDIENLKLMAEAFHQATILWDQELTLDFLIKEYPISLPSIGYLAQYLEQLSALGTLVRMVQSHGGEALNKHQLGVKVCEQLASLCPEITFLLNQASQNQVSHDVITTLLCKLPMCQNHPVLLKALSMNPLFYENLQPSTQEGFENILLGMVKLKLIPEDKYLLVLEKSRSECSSILAILLENKHLAPQLLKKMLASQALNFTHLNLILKHHALDFELYLILIEKANAGIELKDLISHPFFKQLNEEHLTMLVQKSADKDILHQTIKHPKVCESTLMALLKNPMAASQDFSQILNHPNCTKTVICTFAANEELSDEHQKVIAKHPTSPAPVLSNLLKEKPSLMPIILENLLTREQVDLDEKKLIQAILEKEFAPLLQQLSNLETIPNDEQLNNYILATRKKLATIRTTSEIKKLKDELQQIQSIMTSKEVKALLKTIARLEKEEATFFSASGKEKAQKIQKAFAEVSLFKRHNVMASSSQSLVKVQEALAEHRNFFKRWLYQLLFGRARKDSTGKVSEFMAAKAYQELRRSG